MNQKHRNARNAQNDGIALVVIAGLFVAFSVIAAVAVERNTTTQLITRRDATNEQLTRISNAIIEYSVFNKVAGKLVYPCPARADLPISDTNFGASVQTPNGTYADCSSTVGDIVGPPATTVSGYLSILDPSPGPANTDIVRGMVPIQALAQYGLGVNDAFDPWNNRIMYIVNRQQTKNGAYSFTNNPTVNNTTVSDPIITTQAYAAPDFIVMSYGRDGVGASRRESTTVAIACTNGTTKRRLENCDADTAFNINPTYTSASAGDTTYFDDVLSFYRQ